MAVDYRVNTLINAAKRRAGVPETQALYTNDDFVSFLNEAMFGDIVPSILAVQEEYFVTPTTIPLVANQAAYDIPVNAIGNKVRSVELFATSDPSNFVTLPQYDVETVGAYYDVNVGRTGYYFQGSQILLYPAPNNIPNDVSLRVKYYRRPNELIAQSDGATITAVNTGTDTITVSNIPSGWVVGSTMDVTKGRPPFTVVADGITITNISGTDITFSAGDVDNVVNNDTIAEAGFSIVPNISMPEAHRLLVQACIVRLLEGLDDSNGLQVAAGLYQQQLDSFMKIITPRNDASPKKIVGHDDLLDRMSGRGYWY